MRHRASRQLGQRARFLDAHSNLGCGTRLEIQGLVRNPHAVVHVDFLLEATPLTAATAVSPAMNYSLVEKAGCWLPGLPGACDLGSTGCVTASTIIASVRLAQFGTLAGV
jgi:hypothetical protein